jgi:RimJ/RimL family protein N-acetyltransferase
MHESLLTERLRLDPIAPSDADDLHALNSDAAAMRFLGGVRTREGTLAELGRMLALDPAARFGAWAVRRRGDGAFVGRCGVKPGTEAPTEHELLYAYLPAFWGHGYATEAADAVVRRTLAAGAPYVIACAVPANVASIAVLRRVGMTFERRAYLYDEDHEVYVKRVSGA